MHMGPECLFLVMMALLTRQSAGDNSMQLIKLLGGQPKGRDGKTSQNEKKHYQQQVQLEEGLVCRLMQSPWVDKDISSLELLIIFSMRTLMASLIFLFSLTDVSVQPVKPFSLLNRSTWSRLTAQGDRSHLLAKSRQGTGSPLGSVSLLSRSCFHLWLLLKVVALVTSNIITHAEASRQYSRVIEVKRSCPAISHSWSRTISESDHWRTFRAKSTPTVDLQCLLKLSWEYLCTRDVLPTAASPTTSTLNR